MWKLFYKHVSGNYSTNTLVGTILQTRGNHSTLGFELKYDLNIVRIVRLFLSFSYPKTYVSKGEQFVLSSSSEWVDANAFSWLNKDLFRRAKVEYYSPTLLYSFASYRSNRSFSNPSSCLHTLHLDESQVRHDRLCPSLLCRLWTPHRIHWIRDRFFSSELQLLRVLDWKRPISYLQRNYASRSLFKRFFSCSLHHWNWVNGSICHWQSLPHTWTLLL